MSEDEAEATPPEAGPVPDVRRYLPWAGLVVGIWATLPKYSGPALHVRGGTQTEFIDHIVPGIVVIAASLACLLVKPKGESPGLTRFVSGLLVLLAGFWMVATHAPLVAQAARGDAPWAGTIYHSSAALAVFGFGLLWTVFHWSDLSVMEALDQAKKQAPSAS